MAMAERGSFMWLLFSLTQIWLSVKLLEDVEGWLTLLFGGTGAAALMLAILVFRQEQRELLLNPLGKMQKEVHPDEIAKQGKGSWMGILVWLFAIATGSFILP